MTLIKTIEMIYSILLVEIFLLKPLNKNGITINMYNYIYISFKNHFLIFYIHTFEISNMFKV